MAADETGTLTSLKALRREIFEPKTAEYSGRVVKLMGDGTLMEFGSVVDAITFAVEVQRTMAERNAGVPEDRRIAYRIGINIGDIIVEGEDIYGDGVNVAARLEALAEPGSICVSQPVHAQIKGKVDLAFEDLGEQQVKNIPEPVQVFQMLLGQAARPQPAAPTGTRQRLPAISAGLVLSLAAVVALVWWASREPQIEPASPEAMAFPLWWSISAGRSILSCRAATRASVESRMICSASNGKTCPKTLRFVSLFFAYRIVTPVSVGATT